MRPNDFTVLIEIRHASIDPSVLTHAFGVVPEYSWKAGDPKDEDGDVGTRRESYWVARLPLPPMPAVPPELVGLGTALMWAALMFERRKQLWTALQAEGATARIAVTAGARILDGFELSHDVLTMLSKFGLSVAVEVCQLAEATA